MTEATANEPDVWPLGNAKYWPLGDLSYVANLPTIVDRPLIINALNNVLPT